MSKTPAEIAAWYDAFLPYMERDAQSTNPRREHIKGVLRQILKPGMTVLEPGCGIGLNSIFMARDLLCKVTAVDISPRLIERARELNGHENVEYIAGDFIGCPERTREYDAVILCDVLEHIPNERLSLFINAACLRTEGPVYVNLPGLDYQNYISDNAPHLQQIIDNSMSPVWVCHEFNAFGFHPAYMSIYGIDALYQYQEYVFLRSEVIQEQINGSLKLRK